MLRKARFSHPPGLFQFRENLFRGRDRQPLARLAIPYYGRKMPVTAVLRKKGGRPSTGEMPVSAIRLSAEMRQKVDRWADRQDDKPSRSEAIRRLVEIGLKARK